MSETEPKRGFDFGFKTFSDVELHELTDGELLSALASSRKQIELTQFNRDKADENKPGSGDYLQDELAKLFTYITSIYGEFERRKIDTSNL